MQPIASIDARPQFKPPSVLFIIFKCAVLSALLTGTGLVVAQGLCIWMGIR